MKKSFFIIGLFALSLGSNVSAQDSGEAEKSKPEFKRGEIGFRFMPTISSFDMKTYDGTTIKGEATLGFGMGAMLGFNFSNHVGLTGEIIYNSLAQKYRDEEMDRQINIKYINIPLMLSLNTGKGNPVNLKVEAGPQLGYNVGASFSSSGSANSDTIQTVFSTKNSDFGFAYGAGLEFILNSNKTIRLDVGFRGVYGFGNITNTSAPVDGTQFLLQNAAVRTNAAYIGFSRLF
jgi:opacity protein-like surface antigen